MAKGIWYLEFKNQNGITRKRMSIIYNEHMEKISIHVTECFECPDGECISFVLDREDFKRLLETLEEVYKEVCKNGEDLSRWGAL